VTLRSAPLSVASIVASTFVLASVHAAALAQGGLEPPGAAPAAPAAVRGPNALAEPRRPQDVVAGTSVEQAAGVALPSQESLRARSITEPAKELIAKLGSRSYAERRAASERLLESTVALDDLLAALAQGGLSPEQHHRILAIAFERIVNAPRGALGIQMNPARGEPGVRISRVIPGFPAERDLQVDDLVVAIDGRAIRDANDLRMIVQGQPPGTMVRVEAIRAERDERGKPKLDATGAPVTKRIDVRVGLGSKRDLDNAEPGIAGRNPGMGNAAFGIDPLDSARQELGRSLLRRFPAPLVTARLADDAKVEADFASRDVDQHEYVDRLRREIADATAQQREIAPHTIGWYRVQLRALRAMSEDSMLSPAERGWHERVASRLAELLDAADALRDDDRNGR
jgi:hypothetical protein